MDQIPIRKPILAISSCLTSWNETFFLLVRNFLVLPENCWTLSWMSWQDHGRSYSGFSYFLLSPFLIATHNVTLIVFCSSIMNLNLLLAPIYLWRIFAFRWTIYSSIQSVWGARSAKRSIASKQQRIYSMLCYMSFKIFLKVFQRYKLFVFWLLKASLSAKSISRYK